MMLAHAVNVISDRLKGCRFIAIFVDPDSAPRFGSAIVEFAHHFYSLRLDDEVWHVAELIDDHEQSVHETTFSRWVEGMLNALKRNEEGELCSPQS